MKNKPTVLIVDDELHMLESLEEFFEREYHVLKAFNGSKGYELACIEIPDLIITDVDMPKMNGFELCEKVKSTPETSWVPVFILTKFNSRAERLAGLGLGAEHYIPKPFDPDELTHHVTNSLKTSRLLRQADHLLVEPMDVEENDLLSKVVRLVRDNLDSITPSLLAEKLSLDLTSLQREFKALDLGTPGKVILRTKMAKAKDLLRNPSIQIQEIGWDLGYANIQGFSKAFHKYNDISPSDYREQVSN